METSIQFTINQNLKRLDESFRDSRHISCVRFSQNETIKHKLSKCLAGVLASERVPVEDIADFFKISMENIYILVSALEVWKKRYATSDNQDFIQEARLQNGRRIDHLQIALFKQLEFETGSSYGKKDNSIVVPI